MFIIGFNLALCRMLFSNLEGVANIADAACIGISVFGFRGKV